MEGGFILKEVKWYGGKSKQYWLATYNNRIVKAVWLVVLISLLTAAKPFTFGMARLIFALGLSLPEILMEIMPVYMIYKVLSFSLAAIIVVCSIMAMTGKIAMLKPVAFVLAADLVLILLYVSLTKPYSDEMFIIVITLTFRIISLAIVIFAIRAEYFRTKLKEEMAKADKKYDEEKRTGVKQVENEDPDIEGEIIYCTNCGAKVEIDSNFCDECGSRIK